MRKKGLLVFLSLVLALSLVIAGCAKPTPPEEVAPPPEEIAPAPEEEVPPAPKVYKFGAITALSGPMALWGLAEKQAFELGAELVNAEGGVKVGDETYMLEVVLGNTTGEAQSGLDAAYKLIFEDKIDIIYCAMDTVILATRPLFEENGVIMLTGSATPFAGTDFPHIFNTVTTSSVEYDYGVWEYMVENYPDAKTVFIFNPDDAFGRFASATAEALADHFGLELVAPPEFFGWETVDFTPIATKIASLKPDVLNMGSTYEPFAASLLTAAGEMGPLPWEVLMTSWIGGAGIVSSGVDPELVEGMISASHNYVSEAYPPRIREVAQAYIDKYGYIDVYGINFTDQAFVTKSILEQAGSTDKDKIYEYLSSPGAELDSLWGRLGFSGGEFWVYGIDRQLEVPVPVAVTRNGVDVTVRLIPYEESSEIWTFITEERYPGLVELLK